MDEERIYRIPKHINPIQRLGGLDLRGWLVVGSLILFDLLLFMLIADGLHVHIATLIKSFVILAVPPVGMWLLMKDANFADLLFKIRFYRKHKVQIVWESDPNAFIAQEAKRKK